MKKTIILLLSTTLLFTSCGEKKEKKVDETGKTIATGVAESLFESATFIDKYNVYIDYGNSFHSKVNDSYTNYFDWADYEKGPKGAKRIGNVYEISDYALKEVEEALTKEPEIKEIDPLMAVVAEKANTLNKLLSEASSYYKRQDYKDDDFAKGQSIHTDLVKAFEEYYAVYGTMYAEFEVLQDELTAYDTEKFKNNGELIKYNLITSLNASEGILNIIGDLDGPELKNINMEKLDNQVLKFRASFDELEKLIKDEEQVKKEYGNPATINYKLSNFIGYSEDMIREVRNLKERIEKNNFKYSIVHPNIPDNGSPIKLSKLYGHLVGSYNSLN